MERSQLQTGTPGLPVLLSPPYPPPSQGWTREETPVSTRSLSVLTSWDCCLSASSSRCSSSCFPEVGESCAWRASQPRGIRAQRADESAKEQSGLGAGAAGGPGWLGQQEVLGAERSMCWAEPEGVPPAEGPCPANDMVLCLLHGCLGQELSDRELPLPAADQAAFLREVLRRTCHSPGEPLPLCRYQTLQSDSRLGSGLPFPAPQSPDLSHPPLPLL